MLLSIFAIIASYERKRSEQRKVFRSISLGSKKYRKEMK